MDEVKHAVANINHEIAGIRECLNKSVFKDLATCFRCLVCFQHNAQSFYSCPFCGTFLGCFMRINNLAKWPICHSEFKCKGCKEDLHRHPYKIPGIEEFLPTKENKNTRIVPDCVSSDDDLPTVL